MLENIGVTELCFALSEKAVFKWNVMKLLYRTVTSSHMLKPQYTVKVLQIQIWDFKH